MTELDYLSGFGAAHRSEALEGAVPDQQNSPRRGPYGLFPEQVNGTAFTVPRERNLRTWLYRIRPSVMREQMQPIDHPGELGTAYLAEPPAADLLGWRARPIDASADVDFVDSLSTVGGAGAPGDGPGLAFHTYAATANMIDRAFCDGDGDTMILPDTGAIHVRTELGQLRVAPSELVVIPRGLVFQVSLPEGPSRGFVAQVFGRHFRLPGRGVIGANGLADERHFRIPVASYEDREVAGGFRIATSVGGRLYEARRSHSPFDVVGWHGNYVPYKYNLTLFNAMGTITWDHPDPSIFTVLSAPLHHPGENLADLVVFPNERWDVAEHTFRPPYYHRNAASELNAIIGGPASSTNVFARGGYFLTPPFAPHGVANETVARHIRMDDAEADEPTKVRYSSLWIQLESVLPLRIAPHAMASDERDPRFREFANAPPVFFDSERRVPVIDKT